MICLAKRLAWRACRIPNQYNFISLHVQVRTSVDKINFAFLWHILQVRPIVRLKFTRVLVVFSLHSVFQKDAGILVIDNSIR